MNVFVLNTGRCGSITFFKACTRITNYTARHESRVRQIGKGRLAYPQNHIEVDNRLSWFLGRLDEKYGDDAFYVHLLRDQEKVARSFVKRWDKGIIRSFAKGIYWGVVDRYSPYNISMDYVRTVNANIRHFLKDKTNKMEFHLHNHQKEFPIFCERIGAILDMEDALDAFNRRHFAYIIKKGEEGEECQVKVI